jgi:putative endonuclease
MSGEEGGEAVVTTNNQFKGDAGEAQARDYLTKQGLTLVQQNYRVAQGPNARGGEIDLILRDPRGVLVFAEVRLRLSSSHGGAAASISPAKQRSLLLAARHYLRRFKTPPPCRFDVVTIEDERIEWLRGAFDAGAAL